MNSITKRILAMCLALTMVVGLTACGEKENTDNESEEIEYIYQYEDEEPTQDGNNSSDKNNNSQSSGNSSTNKGNNSNKNNSNTNNSNNTGSSNGIRPGETDKHQQIDNTSRYRDLKGRKFTYIAWWDGIDRTSTDGKILTEVEKKLNCKLVERNMSSYQALYTSILSGNPICDIFVPKTPGSVINLASKGMLTPLNELSEFNFNDSKWNKAAIVETSLNGKVYGMTRKMQLRNLLLYNKTMFQKNGWEDLYTLQKNGKLTWDKLTNVIKKAAVVNDNTVARYGLVPMYGMGGIGQILINANGVRAISRTGDSKTLKYNLNSKAAINALNTLESWSKIKGGLYDNTAFGWDSNRDVFASGKAAMLIADHGQATNVAKTANFEIGVVLFPHGPNSKQDLLSASMNTEAIPAGVKNPNDVALFWDVFRDALTDESNINSFKDIMSDASASATADRYIKEFNAGKYIYDFGEDISEFGVAYGKIARGETTPAAATKSLENSVNAYINDFWK